jgi:hypothetical protein
VDDHGTETGAALILALAFVVMIGTICAGLLALVTSSVGVRVPLDAARAREYAADGAVEGAIARVGGQERPGVDPCAPAAGFDLVTLDDVTIRVDCRSSLALFAHDGLVLEQRAVTFTACVDAATTCTDASAIIRAEVVFARTESGAPAATSVRSWTVAG